MYNVVIVQEAVQRTWEPWRWGVQSGQPWEVDHDYLRAIIKLILLQLHEKLPKNSVSTTLLSFSIWSKLERWKISISGWLMSWLKVKKKKKSSKCCLLLLCATTVNHFSIRLWCAMKSGFYMTASNDNQLSGFTEKKLQNTSQSQSFTIKRSWSLFSGLLPVWSITAFWFPATPLHLRSMFSK